MKIKPIKFNNLRRVSNIFIDCIWSYICAFGLCFAIQRRTWWEAILWVINIVFYELCIYQQHQIAIERDQAKMIAQCHALVLNSLKEILTQMGKITGHELKIEDVEFKEIQHYDS